jgi:AraC family transcriptional regulator, ethanolamine operon transcriptional activator
MIPETQSSSVVVRSVEDVDAMASALSDGLEAEYVQLEPRRFVVRWTIVRAMGLTVQFGSEDLAVVRRLRVPADRWAIIVPLHVPRCARWSGRAVRLGDLMICPPRSECIAFDPPGTSFAIVSAGERSALVSAVREAVAGATAPITIAGGAAALALRDFLDRLRLRMETGRVATVDGVALALEIGEAAAACVAGRGEGATPSASRSSVVGRAEQFFRSHVGEAVSISQLSSVAGVSERSLRNAFYDVYTTSPKRYMKLWQLHQVRRALRHADAGAETVTDVATLHGFYELGRFAGEYKSLFGEAPSQTLNKARHPDAVHGDDDVLGRSRRIA